MPCAEALGGFTDRDIHSMKLAAKGRGSIYEKKEKTNNQ
jgi:hypothetical protein